MTAAAMENPAFCRIFAAQTYGTHGVEYRNHNKLLESCPGCIGGKTGYTRAAGRTLVSCAERDGFRLICVTLSDPDDWEDHRRSYDNAFAAFEFLPFPADGWKRIPVISGTAFDVQLSCDASGILVHRGAHVAQIVELPRFLFAPIAAGEAVGTVSVSENGHELCLESIRVSSAVARDEEETLPPWRRYRRNIERQFAGLISAAGLASRRQAEKMISDGRVSVNGIPASVGERADPETDEIRIDGRPLGQSGPFRYILLNKPRGYVTTLSDEKGRKTVAELVSGLGARVYPVGRLDLNSDGLLLLTNDGALANAVMHPRNEVRKVYRVEIDGDVIAALPILRAPMELDGYRIRPAEVTDLGGGVLEITIHEGRNRQVRCMCAAAGLKVRRLTRIAEGPLRLDHLAPGTWRDLSENELERLKECIGYAYENS